MDNLIDKVLAILRKQVNQNNREIRFNQDEIAHLLSEINSSEIQNSITEKQSLHKELLDENEDLINFQLAISDFMEKYSHLFEDIDDFEDDFQDDEYNDTDDDQRCFRQTITGKLAFDRNHPEFHNPGFFNQLLKFYEEKEDYEMCEKLLKILNSQ